MADTKGSALTTITDVAGSDKLYVIDDPGGTPSSKAATVLEALKAVNGETPITPVATDVLFIIDDPGGSPAVAKVTIAALTTLLDDTFATDAAIANMVTTADDTRDLTPIAYNPQTGTSYTLAATDNDRTVAVSNAAAATVTLPLEASVSLPVGFKCRIWCGGVGGVTVATSGTILGGSPNLSIAQDESIHVEKALTNSWIVSGGTS